jgi:ankyrin repeat protein
MRIIKFIGISLIITAFGFTGAQAQSYSASYKFLKAVKDVNYRDIKIAIEKGVNVNTRDYDDKSTALVIAALKKEAPLTQYLLKSGAKPNLSGSNGRTPLVIAATNGDRTIVALLIRFKADLDMADNNGTTPLIAAVLARKDQIVKLLLEQGADHTLEDYSGRTPLQHAIDNRRRRTEKIFKDAGATH